MRSLVFAMALCLSATAALAQDVPDKKSESVKRYNEIVERRIGAFRLDLTKEQFDEMIRTKRELERRPDCVKIYLDELLTSCGPFSQ